MIKVELKNGTAMVGGDFKSALEFIKSIPGRKYDGATKTWIVPMDQKEFVAAGQGLPMDLRGRREEHITRYGNRYTREEWECIKETSESESKIRNEFAPQYNALVVELGTKLEKAGISGKALDFMRRTIANFKLDESLQYGHFRFSSAEREAEIREIEEWYCKEHDRIQRAEDNTAEAANEIIRDKWGF